MAKTPTPATPSPSRVQVRLDLTQRATELVDAVVARLFSRIDRTGASNFIIEKVGALDPDMQDAVLYREGRDRELAMLHALRRKLATYDDDKSPDGSIGRVEKALEDLHTTLARKSAKSHG